MLNVLKYKCKFIMLNSFIVLSMIVVTEKTDTIMWEIIHNNFVRLYRNVKCAQI